MSILVCGGAGYIGSHTVAALLEQGEEVLVADNLSAGHIEALEALRRLYPHARLALHQGDIRDPAFLDRVFASQPVRAVIDFAAHIEVGLSMKDPLAFYDNNLSSVIRLLTAMRKANVRHLVFSSTAAVYGDPAQVPIVEDSPMQPTNPYGETKLAVERLLRWCERAYGITSTCLRYFNACGAHESGCIGEDHRPESHLIPLVLQVALGQRPHIAIFGDDYPTPDGTCVRDYVHVSDLASAHIQALRRLEQGAPGAVWNLGNGQGFSVKDIVEQARAVTGHPIPVVLATRREGDPAVLIASAAAIQSELGWVPRFDRIDEILRSAWTWHKAHPLGY